MLNDVTELRTFVRIVATGSLSAASREMGIALSVVSKRLVGPKHVSSPATLVVSVRQMRGRDSMSMRSAFLLR